MRRNKDRRPRRALATEIEAPTQRQVGQYLNAAIDAGQAVAEMGYPSGVDVPALVAHAFVTTFPAGTTSDQIAAALLERRDWSDRYAERAATAGVEVRL